MAVKNLNEGVDVEEEVNQIPANDSIDDEEVERE